MDAAQIAELRRWAERLAAAEDRDRETKAAGRAILMLLDEIDRLRAEPASPSEPSGEEPPDQEPPPPAAPAGEERPADAPGRRRRLRLGRFTLFVAALGALVFAGLSLGARLAAPDLHASGPPSPARIGPALLPSLSFSVGGDQSTLDRARWSLDGVDVTRRAFLRAGRLVFDGSRLGDGEHVLKVSASGGFPGSRTTRGWRFTIDTTGPEIRLDPPRGRIPSGQPLRLSGTLEAGATLTVDGRPVLVREGRFAVTWPARPRKLVLLTAIDTLRNASTKRVPIVFVPRRPSVPVRAVHVTFYAWADPELRQGILDLIAEGRINAVELDLKDESGTVGFDAPVALGRRIGAVKEIYDLRAAVTLLHGRGVRVIGRLVAFRDPIHARAAWKAGRKAQVVQTPDGSLYAGDYGGFTNLASPVVRRYQIDVAVAAAKAGVDDILYDYVRRPDGPPASMAFPGLKGTPERAIVRFLAESRAALRPYKVFLGASVFGIAATRPLEVAQDIPAMAGHVDYISPMLYPSHWAAGEYGVSSPNAQPYDIVRRSLDDYVAKVRDTGARIVPWLQDFSLGVDYGPGEVAAQIRAAADAGIDEWLLWDPAVTYTGGALSADAQKAVFRKPIAEAAAEAARRLNANELGLVPVLMHHQIRKDGGGDYDLTPAEFRAELDRLWREGYRPVQAVDLVSGRLDVPKGKTPVVLTFDDSTKEQLSYLPDGSIDPDTAIGILLEFQASHPGFELAGTFYPNREPFAGVAEGPRMLRWLAEHGFELGNHTKDHLPLDRFDAEGIQRQLVLGKRVITDAVPGAQVRTMALPLGVMPQPSRLAREGSWGGERYRNEGVFLAGAEPAPSPFSKRFDPAAIPRIRTTHSWHGERDFTSGYWLDLLERNPQLRYVSDGDPRKISFPTALAGELAPRFQDRANPY